MQPAAPEARLPQFATSFIGRQQEIAHLVNLLKREDCHLLTLTGPGGMGKTRLAIEVARQMTFADGIFFVPLQPLRLADNIVTAIVDSLPLQLAGNEDPRQRLLDYLRDRNLLLVLDNFEHLLDGASLVTEILATASHMKLLVTSRERLNLQAEQVWPVLGLDVPEDISDIANTHSAVQLFVERARRVQPDLSLDSQREAVIRICQLVEGLPLALEMAASWARAMPCAAIADEIQHDIHILTSNHRDLPERHRSLRAVLDHSWNLLTPEERTVFPRLAVFRGGFTVDAAEQVAGASLQTLAALIDKSLVKLDGSGRYDLHELVRQYGHQWLESAGEDTVTYSAHCTYYVDFIARRVEGLKGRRQIDSVAEVNADFENIRTAWHWATDHRYSDTIDTMIDGLWTFCWVQSRSQEGILLFSYAERQFSPESDANLRRLWGRLLARSAVDVNSEQQFNTALQIAQDNEDSAEIAFCLVQLGQVAYARHDVDRSDELLEQGATIYRQLGDNFHASRTHNHLMIRGSHERPWENLKYHGEEAWRLSRLAGDIVGSASPLFVVAMSQVRLGNFAQAERMWLDQIAVLKAMGNLTGAAATLAQVCEKIYFIQGRFSLAQSAAEEALQIGTLVDETLAVGFSLITFGLIACVNEDYGECQRLCEEVRSAHAERFTEYTNIAAWGLALVACGQGNVTPAQEYLAVALSYLIEILGDVGIIAGLPIAAVILAHHKQSGRAVELLALAFTHPLDAAGWMKKWPLLDRLQAELQQTLGSAEYSAAWTRGTKLDLEEGLAVLNELAREQAPDMKSPTEAANQALAEPLSKREIEVLALIAKGLSNREMAEQLFISVNTIKKHVQYIYRKLDTKNRTSAVARARELNLFR